MYLGYHEEGDKCPEKDCGGELGYPEVENCSCHIHPPCNACVDRNLTCNECGWEEEAPSSKDVPVAPGLSIREYKPRPLDNTRIDYRAKMHSGSSMIKEGVYPEDATIDEVENVVKGSFGGRFTLFSEGKFRYIAYTD